MTRRDELLRDVLNTARDLNRRLVALDELASKRRRITDADVVWCRGALLAEAERERS